MTIFALPAVLTLLLVIITYLCVEAVLHNKRRNSIPIRIWVNGTRGKSSVTRLIAAGLRAGGKKVIAKTTGTRPRLILRDDFEIPVVRRGRANIIEQIRILKSIAKKKPEACVLECMALRPDLQQIESKKIVQPTLVVITNVREDHLDVMGPTKKDIARTFIKVIPQNCHLYTTESTIFRDFERYIQGKNIKIHVVEAKYISNTTMEKFTYMEHKDNVALCLGICEYFGIPKDVALNGMYRTNPDPGALRKYKLDLDGKKVVLINAMAANDPHSILQIWQSIDKRHHETNLLINCRSDRIDRSIQLAHLISNHFKTENYIITGEGTNVLKRNLYRTTNKNRILYLGGKPPVNVVKEVIKFVSDDSLIFAIGNTVGYGEKVMAEFLKREVKYAD